MGQCLVGYRVRGRVYGLVIECVRECVGGFWVVAEGLLDSGGEAKDEQELRGAPATSVAHINKFL